MEMEDERRVFIQKRNNVKADTPLGHRYSNAVCLLEQKAQLDRNFERTLAEIHELEFEEIL